MAIQTITEEQILADFARLLTQHNLTYNDFVAIGESCTKQCGCELYDIDEDLAFAFKVLGPFLKDPF